ncbi:hypothetical protein DLAC_02769 [Tieghemostelium lacteum]|uniref:Uncharacterized protein n=1 Tax=Tieghemostelium lacteum TaxID=361077 RepID=A0A152A3A8_TIELA|nr:hypothetical protein DLAC_02769 [Tieghemostelium lacteum]|eukprot:KYR00728.1 hypothetical protein DLAC_02769 [Tieghemostelium lacteum]
MNTIIRSSLNQLMKCNGNTIIQRQYTSKTKHNQPKLKKTTMICTNGATLPIWTSLPHGKIWRAQIDCFSHPPVFEFDSIKVIRDKRERELEEKLKHIEN